MVNIKMVAQKAGVSPSTVSRALNGKSYVHQETKRRVMETVKELNYSPNGLAKGLKLGTSSIIAFLVSSMQNQMFPLIAQGVSDTARKNGYGVILCIAGEDPLVERDYISKLQKWWVDGFLIASMLPSSQHIYDLQQGGTPVELIARHYDETVSAIVINNYRAAQEAVEYLVSTGHKKIAIACGPRELPLYQQRYQAYLDVLQEHGLEADPDFAMLESNETRDFYDMTIQMLEKGKCPDAIFATTDEKAIVIMRALKDKGLAIPEDVSVMGFDNIGISPYVDPPLTTVSQPFYEMGVLATERLISMIADQKPQPPIIDVLETELIIRKSTRLLR